MKKTLSSLILIAPLILSACGGQDKFTDEEEAKLSEIESLFADAPSTDDAAYYESRVRTSINPKLEEYGEYTTAETVQDVCERLKSGEDEDAIVAADSPVDDSGYRRVIRIAYAEACPSAPDGVNAPWDDPSLDQ
ncbi:hypothetical protein ACL1EX_04605 [Corynebacterium striatum]